MKNKFRFLLGIVWLLAGTASFGQLNSLVTTPGTTAEMEGSPYLDENFIPGVVYQDKSTHKVALRYNIYKDVMEYMQGNVNMYLAPGPKLSKVTIGGNVFVVDEFEYKHEKKYGYLALLDSGHVTLYSKKVVRYYSARKGGPPDFIDHPAGYDRESDVFYYRIGNGELQELESIKSMIATLPERQEELAAFAKKEKISPSKEQKVLKFVQYYNSLVAEESLGE